MSTQLSLIGFAVFSHSVQALKVNTEAKSRSVADHYKCPLRVVQEQLPETYGLHVHCDPMIHQTESRESRRSVKKVRCTNLARQ
jgi:hypothetical protein